MGNITGKTAAEAALLIGMLVSVFAEGVCAFAENRKEIEEDVFRLHIMANSDSDEDQQLKLKVRNAVLEAGADVFLGNMNADDAALAAEENLELFRTAAEKAVKENGYDYPVSCFVTEMPFDERTYGSATLPAGTYSALRVNIGSGEGKNWWCVMFPPLCLPAVTNTDEVLAEAEADGILTAEELALIRDPSNYEVRFYFAELWKKLIAYAEKGAET